MADRIRAAVIGGTGYIGAELLRYLSVHPRVELCAVTARGAAGKPITEILPNLEGILEGSYTRLEDTDLGPCSIAFTALPHNTSQEVIPGLAERYPHLKIIDMGGDFRSGDLEGYRRYYGQEHRAPDMLRRFVYGLTEFNREAIREAAYVANPGCFATALLLGLAPLRAAGLLRGSIPALGITGSSGSGKDPRTTTHHPERATNVRVYKPLIHQHLLEVESFLGRDGWRLDFVPCSGPFVRGIFMTLFVSRAGIGPLERAFGSAYGSDPLVTVVKGTPELRVVQGTPRSIVGLAGDDDRGVVFVAIDNLGKGAAGQAVENMNLMFGWDPVEGLRVPGGFV